jgi:hypothetical protein
VLFGYQVLMTVKIVCDFVGTGAGGSVFLQMLVIILKAAWCNPEYQNLNIRLGLIIVFCQCD